MNVRLISITKPLIDGIETAEDLIIHNARVSNPSNQLNVDTGGKLLNYCIRNSHWSVLEQADLTVEIKTSRAIAAQILRHKSFFFQEKSQRYSAATDLESIEFRLQGKTNRQVGDDLVDLTPEQKILVDAAQSQCLETYQTLLDAGIAKECARFVLPLNTSTTMYMKGSVRSWVHYFQVRCTEHCQKEHRDIAVAIRDIFIDQFPIISEALNFSKSSSQ